MPGQKKIRVAVVYGGRSGEHEVALQSAASVIRNLDPTRFEVIPISVDKRGRWRAGDLSLLSNGSRSLPVFSSQPSVVMAPFPSDSDVGKGEIVSVQSGAGAHAIAGVDVVFPVMHGPLGEDGTVQGLFELAEVAYVGSGVLASAVGMDKEFAKRLAREAGIPIVPFVSIGAERWMSQQARFESQIERELGYPVFVKPANAGSSVGVHKVKSPSELSAALKDAFRYDSKALVEKAIAAREIELSALEGANAGDPPRISVVGEIRPTHEFYSYEAKYLDENGAELMIPAQITKAQSDEAQTLAARIFETLGLEGMARVDLFLDRDTEKFYFNEVNTIPGFTSISMYPKLWEASGMPYAKLLSELIDLALSRQARKRKLSREYLPE